MIYGDRTKEHRNQHGRDGKDNRVDVGSYPQAPTQ